jgi:hypothetical protein
MATNMMSLTKPRDLFSALIATLLHPPSDYTPALFRQHNAHTNLQLIPSLSMGNPTFDRHNSTALERHRPLTPPEDCLSAQQREDDQVDTLTPRSPMEDEKHVMDTGHLSSSNPVAKENSLHYAIGCREWVQLSLRRQLTPVAQFALLTSLDSLVLPSRDIMYVNLTFRKLESRRSLSDYSRCLPTLKVCKTGLELEECAKFSFEVLEVAKLPQTDVPTCNIKKLIVQVPIDFLYVRNSDDRIFGYLPSLVDNAPDLEYLALQLMRQASFGLSPGNEIGRSYYTLIRDL